MTAFIPFSNFTSTLFIRDLRLFPIASSEALHIEISVSTIRIMEKTAHLAPDVDSDIASPFVVDWEGEDDLQKPMNWSNTKKWRNVFLISLLTLIS